MRRAAAGARPAVAIGGNAMSGEIFRPRKRPALRIAAAVVASALLILAAGVAMHLRTHVVPPGCDDPDTLALVRRSLLDRFRLPPGVTIDDIQMHAGGYFAFRIACEASLGGIDPHDLPPGTPVPGSVYYVSRLTDGGKRHEVTVRVYPLLKLERVQ
jgi:hypothetical protein